VSVIWKTSLGSAPGRYAFTDNFREVEDKVELVALPAAI
jgi:hypothetical protein